MDDPDARADEATTDHDAAPDAVPLETLLSLPPAVYDLFSSRHRRLVLEYLLEREEPAAVSDLVAHVVDSEPEPESGSGSVSPSVASGRTEVRIRITHVTLPKLDECDVVEWNPARGEVALADGGLVEDLAAN